MGYITHYKLDVTRDGEKPTYDETPISDLRSHSENAKYALNESGETKEGCKWYKHEDDLKKLSLDYPEFVFVLHGDGEEQGDTWKKFFKNGKMQTEQAKITYGKYDSSKLK